MLRIRWISEMERVGDSELVRCSQKIFARFLPHFKHWLGEPPNKSKSGTEGCKQEFWEVGVTPEKTRPRQFETESARQFETESVRKFETESVRQLRRSR